MHIISFTSRVLCYICKYLFSEFFFIFMLALVSRVFQDDNNKRHNTYNAKYIDIIL